MPGASSSRPSSSMNKLDNFLSKQSTYEASKVGGETDGAYPSKFAGYYHKSRPRQDTRQRFKSEVAQGRGGMFRGRKVDLRPEDLAYWEQRRKEEELFQFDDWAQKAVNITDPAQYRFFQKIHPEYVETREKVIDDLHELSARVAKIRLRNVKTKEDLMFLYAIARGVIKLPEGELWKGRPSNSNTFAPGTFSILKVLNAIGKDKLADDPIGNANTMSAAVGLQGDPPAPL